MLYFPEIFPQSSRLFYKFAPLSCSAAFLLYEGTTLTKETKNKMIVETNENKLEQGAFLPQCNGSHFVDEITENSSFYLEMALP